MIPPGVAIIQRILFGGSSLLSCICSVLIIQHVVRSKCQRKVSPTYLRLLLGLSFYDFMSSFTNFCGSLGPSQTEPSLSCTLNGFARGTGVGSAGFYNANLAIFFMLMVVFGTRERTIATYIEPVFHVVANVAIPAFTLSGLFLEVYNPSDGLGHNQCWMQPYPSNCDTDEDVDCERGGDYGPIYRTMTFLLFLPIILILLTSCMLIYFKVRWTERRNERFVFTNSAKSTQHPTGVVESDNRAAENSTSRTNKAAALSILFCGGFFLTYVPTIVREVATDDDTPEDLWWVLTLGCVESMTFPLQGLFDSLVYFRPRYMEWRRHGRDGAELSRWYALRLTLFTSEQPVARRCRTRPVGSSNGTGKPSSAFTDLGSDDCQAAAHEEKLEEYPKHINSPEQESA